MLKKAIRDEYLKKRLLLNEEDLEDNTSRIILQFASLHLPVIHYLLSYYPITEKKEFDISAGTALIADRFPDVKIAWPRIESDKNSMEAYLIRSDGLFSKNKYNILEPINGEWVAPEKIDLVFVPLVNFDSKGFRVGYGKGFYDRYLARCRPDVLKIGFSFFEPVKSIRDINHFDVPLSLCITPSRIYEF